MAKQTSSRRRRDKMPDPQYQDADHPLRVRAAQELIGEKPETVERIPGETDEHYAWRSAILRSVLELPDAD
jgi:hypothetical protein